MSKASAYFIVENVVDEHDTAKIKRDLDKLKGVSSVSINDAKSRITVDYDTTASDPEAIGNKLDELGYTCYLDSQDNLLM